MSTGWKLWRNLFTIEFLKHYISLWRKKEEQPHDHPWNLMVHKDCDTPIECGENCPGEWVKIEPLPNRRAAIEATKLKKEKRTQETM